MNLPLVLSVKVAAVALLLAGVGPIGAQTVSLSADVAITSDYTSRGISQTLEQPAVQGGFGMALPVGVYAGLWGSNVNFGEDLASGARAQMELDVSAGVARTYGGTTFDLGVIHFAYPGAAAAYGYDFTEVTAGVARALGPVELGVSGAFSPDFFAGSGTGVYAQAALSAPVTGTPFALAAQIGRQSIEDNEAWGTPDYVSWSTSLSADLFGLTVGAGVVGTDLSGQDCYGGSDLCRTRVVVSVARGI